MVSNVYKMLK